MPGSILRGARTGIGPLSKLAAGIRAGTDLSKANATLSRGPNLAPKLNAAAWSNTWPSPGATLDLDFANNRGFVRGVGQGGAMDAVTFTRASSGTYVDSAGVVQTAGNNVSRFDWASTSQVAFTNLLTYTEAVDNSAWGVTQNTTVTANAANDPNGNATADKIVATSATDPYKGQSVFLGDFTGQYTQSVWLWTDAGQPTTAQLNLFKSSASSGASASQVSTSTITLTTTPTRYSLTGNFTSDTSRQYLCARIDLAESGAQGGVANEYLYAWGAQLERGSSASTYKSVGAATTQTPLAAATSCNGLLIEESRANRLLWCRDATNAAWSKTNITAAKDATGIDGVANAASSLTATSGGGTCIQTITLASGSRTGSVYLKRITGTGDVQVSLDGSTWSTVDLSNGSWNRIVLSGTVTNPVVGVKLATNGDAVACDYGQVEDGSSVTSAILTTTASVTRSADNASIGAALVAGFYNISGGYVYAECSNSANDSSQNRNLFNLLTSVSNRIYVNVGNGGLNYTGTVSGSGYGLTGTYTFPLNQLNRVAYTFTKGYLAGATNGTLATDFNGGLLPDVNQFVIGGFTSNSFFNGTIKRMVYGAQRLNRNSLVVMTGGAS